MRKTLLSLSTALAISGCAVPVYTKVGVHVPSTVVYVAPSYPQPGIGWVWIYHPRHGWGWRHPRHGWHRGWH